MLRGQDREYTNLEKLLTYLPPDEGEMNNIYGHIGSGKTYCATRDILDDLKRGIVWYVNWKIVFNGYDERKVWWKLLLGILGLKREFLFIPASNLHYMMIDDPNRTIVDGVDTNLPFALWVSRITDAKLGFDEAHTVWDSYVMTKIDKGLRNAALWTRHFDRTYLLVSQRPQNIHVQLRANINRFYKTEKTIDWKIWFTKWRIQRFRKTEFQDVANDSVPDERRALDPDTMLETGEYVFALSIKKYWARKYVFEAYDSKYRRASAPSSQNNNAQVIHTSWLDRFRMLFRI